MTPSNTDGVIAHTSSAGIRVGERCKRGPRGIPMRLLSEGPERHQEVLSSSRSVGRCRHADTPGHSNSPRCTTTRNTAHSSCVNPRAGPRGFFESRTQTCSWMRATSTQAPPLPPLVLLFFQDAVAGGGGTSTTLYSFLRDGTSLAASNDVARTSSGSLVQRRGEWQHRRRGTRQPTGHPPT